MTTSSSSSNSSASETPSSAPDNRSENLHRISAIAFALAMEPKLTAPEQLPRLVDLSTRSWGPTEPIDRPLSMLELIDVTDEGGTRINSKGLLVAQWLPLRRARFKVSFNTVEMVVANLDHLLDTLARYYMFDRQVNVLCCDEQWKDTP